MLAAENGWIRVIGSPRASLSQISSVVDDASTRHHGLCSSGKVCLRTLIHRSRQCISQVFRAIWPMVDLIFPRVILQSEQFLFGFGT